MYLLYLDESGNEKDPTDRYFVLGGMAIFEREAHYLTQELEEIQAKHLPGLQPVAFHATEIRSGKGFWRKVPDTTRNAVVNDILGAIGRRKSPLFAAAIEKSDKVWGELAVERATEEVCKRFDIFLMRRFQIANDAQRGLIIFSKGRFDARAGVWVRGFRERGTRWGAIKNLADVPYFVDMRETRLLQVADFVAHAAFLLYERRDPSMILPLLDRFRTDGVLHNLVHVRSKSVSGCDCPACSTRRMAGDDGPWVQPKPLDMVVAPIPASVSSKPN